MSRFTTFIDAVRYALCANGNSPAYGVTPCSWQPSREVQEPLPRTIGPAGCGEWGEAWQLRRARRFPRALLRHSVVGRQGECTRASFDPRNTRVLFRWVCRVLACSQIKIATGDDESAGGGGQEPTRRGDEGQQRARRRRSGKVGILCPGGPCGWAVTGAIFGSSAILHQSRPIQAGPAVEDRYSASAARDPVTRPVDPVVHSGGHA